MGHHFNIMRSHKTCWSFDRLVPYDFRTRSKIEPRELEETKYIKILIYPNWTAAFVTFCPVPCGCPALVSNPHGERRAEAKVWQIGQRTLDIDGPGVRLHRDTSAEQPLSRRMCRHALSGFALIKNKDSMINFTNNFNCFKRNQIQL